MFDVILLAIFFTISDHLLRQLIKERFVFLILGHFLVII